MRSVLGLLPVLCYCNGSSPPPPELGINDSRTHADTVTPDAGPDHGPPDSSPVDAEDAQAKPDAWTGWLFTAGVPGTSATVEGRAIAADGKGDVFVAGIYMGTPAFGKTTLGYYGKQDIFTARLTKDGQPVWVTSFGSTVHDWVEAIALDAAGNCYVSGTFGDKITFGTTTLVPQGESDVFVVKLDSKGNVKWVATAGGPTFEVPFGIAVDGKGNASVSGFFAKNMVAGGTTIKSLGSRDVFLFRVTSSGASDWVLALGGPGEDFGYDVVTDAAGNALVTGFFRQTGLFGTHSLQATGQADLFVAKVDPKGSVLWAKRAGGVNTTYGTGIELDPSGDILVSGTFFGSSVFGTTTIKAFAFDVFLAKLTPAGEFLWAQDIASTQLSTSLPDLAVGSSGASFISGMLWGSATIGKTPLTAKGTLDGLVARYDPSGANATAITADLTDKSLLEGIAAGQGGDVYLTGGFIGSATFGPETRTAKGYMDLFVCKVPTGDFPQ